MMDSISPHVLRQVSGNMTLMTSSALLDQQGSGHSAPLKRLLRLAMRRRRVLIGCLAAGAALGLIATLLSPRQYTSTERLQISRDTAQVVNVGAISHDVSTGDQEFYQTQYGLLRTQALAERVARDIGAADDPAFFRMFGHSAAFAAAPGPVGRDKRIEAAGRILLEHVVVAPLHGSSLVDVEATTRSPALSLKIAQTWSEDFIAAALERRLDAAGYARRYLEARIDQLREKLETSERKAAEYATAEGIIDLPSPTNAPKSPGADPSQGRSLVTDDLIAMNAAREGAANERIQAGSRLAAASDQPGASSDALNYRAMGLLREERADVAANYAKLAAQLAPDDPAAKAAHAQIDALDTAIQNEQNRVRTALQQTYQAATSREKALDQRVRDLKGTLAEQRRRSIQYNIYQRDAETNRDLYEGLLQRYKEIGVAGEAESTNVAVIDPAQAPNRPSSPRLVLNLLLFILGGAVAAGAAVAVLEQIDDGVTDPDSFTQKLGLPLLGVTPKLRGQAPLEALKNPRSALAEAYLVIGANLKLAAPQGVPQSFAIVGGRPREGASTTAVALAQGLARARRSVVLIDADLRSPSLHAAFGLENAAGLSDALLRGGDIEILPRPTRFEGLSLVTAGAETPNPADLLIGDGLTTLVRALQARFEHVILDCPAMLDLADTPLIVSAVDKAVYVVASKGVSAGDVRATLGRIDKSRVAGGVLTMVETR